jgi:uncharacterized protein
MLHKQTHDIIKSTVASLLPDARVFLFGSRARGDFKKHSDYDLLIVTKSTYPVKEKSGLATTINSTLVKKIHAPFDIILQSEIEVETYKNYYGHIVRYAMKEAVEL